MAHRPWCSARTALCAAFSTCALGLLGGAAWAAGEPGVTLIVKTAANPYFVSMADAAKAQAKADGVKLTLAAGQFDGDTNTQVRAIEDAVARGDKGILITLNGPAVDHALQGARQDGLYVVALDTAPTDPAAADITFATNNFAAGEAIGRWAAARLDGKRAVIAMIDDYATQNVSVDYERDTGFLTGMGIAVPDKKRNGSEAPEGRYSGGKGGEYLIVGHQASNGEESKGRTAMEMLLSKNSDINVVYTINEPAAYGAYQALKAAGQTDGVLLVSIDGGCTGVNYVKQGILGATSQQYPSRMAKDGMDAIVKFAKTGEKASTSAGLGYHDTGSQLVTDQPVAGVPSIDSKQASAICWGKA